MSLWSDEMVNKEKNAYHFQDFDHASVNNKTISKSIHLYVEDLLLQLHLEVTELISNDVYKNYFNKG